MYLSLKQYKKLMIIGGTCFGLGIGINYISSTIWGYYGISIGNLITMGIYGFFLINGLKNYFENFRSNITKLLQIGMSFLATLIIIYLIKDIDLFNYGSNIFVQLVNVFTNYIIIFTVFILFTLIFHKELTLKYSKDVLSKIKIN